MLGTPQLHYIIFLNYLLKCIVTIYTPNYFRINYVTIFLESRKWGFKRWGFEEIRGYLRKKADFLHFLDFPGALRTLRKREKKGRKRAKKADFGRFPGRAARHPLSPHLLHPHLLLNIYHKIRLFVKPLAHRNRSDFCDLRLRCPSQTPEIARFPRQEKAMLHCDLRVRWKVASDLRFRAATSEPETPSFFGKV